jgi:hypothetical protein
MIYTRLLSQMFRAKCIAVENKDRCENTQKESRFSRSDRSVKSTWDVTHVVDRFFKPKIDRLYQRNNLATMPLRIATPNNHQYHLTPSAWWGDLPNSRATKAS